MAEAESVFRGLRFDNSTLRALPIDPIKENFVRGNVRHACFSRVQPTSLYNPKLVAASSSALRLVDMDGLEASAEFVEAMAGNKIIPGSEPASHCYCGHQFGVFAGQLGDGAAIYLGEVINRKGERWEIQLKGAGKTPYSRDADGRKVLRSSMREFLASEAMHALGIPTTRAGSLITSDTRVERDPYYDGNVVEERASVVLRIAPTFLRFGSFEIFKSMDPLSGRRGPSFGLDKEMLPLMLDHTIRSYFGDQSWSKLEDPTARYLAFFEEVVHRTARLVAMWQSVGFCHGVLNTDNMSVLGLTLDYGPYGFLDAYNPNFIPNGSDKEGRYDFKGQPSICRWNCNKFAEALQGALPLSLTRPIVDKFDELYAREYLRLMRRKLGLLRPVTPAEDASDNELVADLLQTMETSAADFTNTFRLLRLVRLEKASAGDAVKSGRSNHSKTSDYCHDCSIGDGNHSRDTSMDSGARGVVPAGSIGNGHVDGGHVDLGERKQQEGIAERRGTTEGPRGVAGDVPERSNQGQEGERPPEGFGMEDKEAGGVPEGGSKEKRRPQEPESESDEAFLAAVPSVLGDPKVAAAVHRPKMAREQLVMFMQIAETQPQLLALVGLSPQQLRAEVDKFEAFKRMGARKPEEKAMGDKRLWRAWVAKYRARLHTEVAGLGTDDELARVQAERDAVMCASNPRVVLRNYLAHTAILKAEEGDFTEVRQLLAALSDPFSDTPAEKGQETNGQLSTTSGTEQAFSQFASCPPPWASTLCVTCSS